MPRSPSQPVKTPTLVCRVLLTLGFLWVAASVGAQIIPTSPPPTPRPTPRPQPRSIRKPVRKPAPKPTPKPIRKAPPSADVQRAIQQNYNAMAAAMRQGDVSGTLAFYASDFSQVSPEGERTSRAEFQADLQAIADNMKSFQAKTVISKLSLDGGGKRATATVRMMINVTVRDPETGSDAKLVGTEDSVDTWIRTANGWRLQHSKTRKETLNGKPVSP
jgi:ketosteroid isomerase-like protein